jgi:hypothetical protein
MLLTRKLVRHSSVLLALSAVAACGAPPAVVSTGAAPAPPPITDGAGVVRAMHDRYNGKWFSTLTFAQNTITYSANGRETKGVWNEYLAIPGRLRIDFLPLSDHSGVLYADGKVHSFVNGKPTTQSGLNPALVLIGDVYAQPPEETLRQLDTLGFQRGVVRQETWRGKPHWVVGAPAGDTTSSQFWVDTDSLLVRRIIQKNTTGARTTVTDIHLDDYKDAGGYPVAFKIMFYRDGRLFFREDYFDVKTNVAIPAEVFDPAKWVEAQPSKPGT